MRSLRTIREGSVGLLVIAGLGVFGLIFLWLNRFTASSNSYKAVVEFKDAGGIQKGAVVRYRGVKVGRTISVKPGLNAVEVEIEINQPELIIPSNVTVEASQSGLISEGIIDIIPRLKIPEGAIAGKPLEKTCDSNQIICNNSRLKGQIGISIDQVLRSTNDLAVVYSNPKFYANLNQALQQATLAASGVASLSKDLSSLSSSAKNQLNDFSGVGNSVQRAVNQASSSTTQLSANANQTLDKFAATAGEFGITAKELRTTNSQAVKLLANLDNLVVNNRSSLVSTLNNLSASSSQLRTTVSSLSPTVNRLTQGELIKNFEILSANAAEASTNLRDATKTLNDPKNAILLQQTLDSARVTFENTQKLTSDLDELTGDPKFRTNLRQLVNGLSNLVSSTQEIEQQVKVAQTLDSMKAGTFSKNTPVVNFNAENSTFPTPEFSQIPPTTATAKRNQAIKRLTKILHQNNQAAKVSVDKSPEVSNQENKATNSP
jgi:phospholipid/cholesterol/gamma-HCH transport system substrate-binding protein